MITCRSLGILLPLAAMMLPMVSDATAQVVSREYSIKAGVVTMLGKCVTWPKDVAPARGEALKIGILGKDPFLENGINQFDSIVSDEKLKGNHIVLKQFDSAKDYEPCHILFISNLASETSEEKTVTARFEAAKIATDGKAVLVVGETSGLASQGAVANLVFDRTTNLIRLEINPDAAGRAGLRLPPDLLRLRLVKIVRDPQG